MSARAELEAARKTMLNSLAEAYIFQQKLDPTQAADLARVNEFKTSLEKDGFSDPAKLTSYMESLGNTDLIKEAHRGYTRALTAFENEKKSVEPQISSNQPPAVAATTKIEIARASAKIVIDGMTEAFAKAETLDKEKPDDKVKLDKFGQSVGNALLNPSQIGGAIEAFEKKGAITKEEADKLRGDYTKFSQDAAAAQEALKADQGVTTPQPAPAKMAGQQPPQDKWVQAGLGKILEKTGLTIEEYAKAKGITSPDQLGASVKQDVAALQSELRDGGHPAGKFGPAHDGVDGKWGPATENALGQAGGKSEYLDRIKTAGKATPAAKAPVAEKVSETRPPKAPNGIQVDPVTPEVGPPQTAAAKPYPMMEVALQSKDIMAFSAKMTAVDVGGTPPEGPPQATPARPYVEPREIQL